MLTDELIIEESKYKTREGLDCYIKLRTKRFGLRVFKFEKSRSSTSLAAVKTIICTWKRVDDSSGEMATKTASSSHTNNRPARNVEPNTR